MRHLRFYIFFNSISVISRRSTGYNEKKLCAMEPRLRLEKSPPPHSKVEHASVFK